MFSDLKQYEQFIPSTAPTSLGDLPIELRIYHDPKVEVWFSPMSSEKKNPKLWILGITPGWAQMRIAYEEAARALSEGLSPGEAIARPKPSVAFAGSMRNNLISMLDDLELAKLLGTSTSSNLFGTDLLKTGSALRFPVFKNGSNYNGHSPKPLSHPTFLAMLDQLLAEEIKNTDNCLVLPLGRAVEEMLGYAVTKNLLSANRILRGFPHPSGANGHRKRQYSEGKEKLKRQIAQWFHSAA
jgi:hypothetical protein